MLLKPRGIFVQWLPYRQADNASLKMIAQTFQHVYPQATMWLNRFKGYTLLLGTREPLHIDMARLKARFQLPPSSATWPKYTWPRHGNSWKILPRGKTPSGGIRCGEYESEQL